MPIMDADQLRALLDYDPVTGAFRWKVPRRRHGAIAAGAEAGWHDKDGYRKIRTGGRAYRCARLAWLLMTGEWPAREVDHENRIRDDDRWANLRLAARPEQMANCNLSRANKSGAKGVYTHGARWRATIGVGGRDKHLGTFDSFEDAVAARAAAQAQYHGEFAAKPPT